MAKSMATVLNSAVMTKAIASWNSVMKNEHTHSTCVVTCAQIHVCITNTP